MTEIWFYQLRRQALEQALPGLLEKVLAAGKRAVVMAGSEERVAVLDDALWTFGQGTFLAHGSARDGNADRQPIWLTAEDENPNGASVLVLTDGAASDRIGEYERCLEMFDGRDEGAAETAKERWRAYSDAGHEVTYWRQNERGKWERKE